MHTALIITHAMTPTVEVRAWMSNYILLFKVGIISYTCPNFNTGLINLSVKRSSVECRYTVHPKKYAYLCTFLYIIVVSYQSIYPYTLVFPTGTCVIMLPLQWRHNEHDGVSNHRGLDCLLNRLFRCRSKKTSKLRVTGLCDGNSLVTGEFPAQRASDAESFSIRWRHHDSTNLATLTNMSKWGGLYNKTMQNKNVTCIWRNHPYSQVMNLLCTTTVRHYFSFRYHV